MANLRSSTGSPRQKHLSSVVLLLSLILVQSEVSCYQYKVGDLDAWGVPASASEQVYGKWSKLHTFSIGDSLRKLAAFPSTRIPIEVIELNPCRTHGNRVRLTKSDQIGSPGQS